MVANDRDEIHDAPIGSSELQDPALVQALFTAVFC